MRRGARTGRGGLALDNVFRRLLVASLQHRLASRIWGLDLRWTGPKEPFLSCVSCGICQRKGQTQLVARFWLDAKLRKRHFDFARLSILARRIVPCPTFFLARALEDTSLCVYIWLAVPLAQVIRDVEPPLTLLPMGRSPVFGINKHFRKQPFASMRNPWNNRYKYSWSCLKRTRMF